MLSLYWQNCHGSSAQFIVLRARPQDVHKLCGDLESANKIKHGVRRGVSILNQVPQNMPPLPLPLLYFPPLLHNHRGPFSVKHALVPPSLASLLFSLVALYY